MKKASPHSNLNQDSAGGHILTGVRQASSKRRIVIILCLAGRMGGSIPGWKFRDATPGLQAGHLQLKVSRIEQTRAVSSGRRIHKRSQVDWRVQLWRIDANMPEFVTAIRASIGHSNVLVPTFVDLLCMIWYKTTMEQFVELYAPLIPPVVAFFLVACGIASAYIASRRGSFAVIWFVVGALLGPMGIAMAFASGWQCPRCRMRIHKEATLCGYCHADYPPYYAVLPAADEAEGLHQLPSAPHSVPAG